MDSYRYERLNNYVMGVIYSPALLVTSVYETYQARKVRSARKRGDVDDDEIEEWEQIEGEVDFESEGWEKKVMSSKPDVEVDTDVVEIRELKKQVDELMKMVSKLSPTESNGK